MSFGEFLAEIDRYLYIWLGGTLGGVAWLAMNIHKSHNYVPLPKINMAGEK